jgi:hypothetical protein
MEKLPNNDRADKTIASCNKNLHPGQNSPWIVAFTQRQIHNACNLRHSTTSYLACIFRMDTDFFDI